MRPASRGSTGFFTTREILRLSSAIFLLGIVGLLYMQAKKSSSWRTIATEMGSEESVAAVPTVSDASWQELVVEHPGHTDAEEIDALKEELQAVSDMTPLAGEEMPAYWRMVKWAYAVSGEELKKQARTDLQFTHLFQAPNKNRGELVNVKLHVRLTRQHVAPENSANVKTVYEAWGPTEESQTYPYCVVFVDLPPGVKIEGKAFLDARFVGFFLKKLAYEDSAGVKRTAPLLIGRMIYDEEARTRNLPKDPVNVKLIVGIVVGLVVVVLLIQWWAGKTPHSQRAPAVDDATVDSFLGELEVGGAEIPPPKPPDGPPPD
jgi:hypothetical protein